MSSTFFSRNAHWSGKNKQTGKDNNVPLKNIEDIGRRCDAEQKLQGKSASEIGKQNIQDEKYAEINLIVLEIGFL